MKIALAGGAGFIGSNIADSYINQGHEVHIFDNLSTGMKENINPKAKFYEIDINSKEIKSIFEKEKYDILNNQAAQIDVRISVEDPRYDAEINILGGINLYETAKITGVKKVIFASSGGAIYGDQDYFPADEAHPTRPCSPYGICKLTNEKYLNYYKEVFGMDFVALRYANVYGPRQNYRGEAGVVAIFIHKMLNGGQPVINGDGGNTRDYVYVGDVVEANLIALKKECSGIFNVGTGIESDVNYVFNNLKKLTGANIDEIHGEAKKGEQRRSVISYRKLQDNFGWQPQVNFRDGLERTVGFFRNSI